MRLHRIVSYSQIIAAHLIHGLQRINVTGEVALLTVSFCFICLSLTGQNKVVCGYVLDSLSGENLISATIVTNDKLLWTSTNNYGFFSLSTYNDSIRVFYVGYQSKKIAVKNGDTCINIFLKPANELKEVTIKGDKRNYGLSGVNELSMKTIKVLPIIAGEKDILKSFQTIPGVQGGVEGTSGLYIRGGSPDQNLILIDGAPVYNVNHFFGIFSVFNTDVINNAVLYKGYIPPQYGGRVSSVLDITLKDGNQNSFQGNMSCGLISSRLFMEDSFKNSKISWILSARRTYVDLLLRPFIKDVADGAVIGYNFYDLNAKICYRLNKKHKLFINFYTGRDKYSYKYDYSDETSEGDILYEKSKEGTNWGNFTSTIRWNWLMNPKTFSNLTLVASDYKMSTNSFFQQESKDDGNITKSIAKIDYLSEIRDFSIKWDIEHVLFPSVKIKSGISNSILLFRPDNNWSSVGNILDSNNNNTTIAKISAIEMAGYFNSQFTVLSNLDLNAGIRVNSFYVDKTNHLTAEPRINVCLDLNEMTKLTLAYCHASQNIHLLTRSNMGLPNDIWVPSTSLIRPSFSKQYSFGVEKRFGNEVTLSSELFFKKMKYITEYKDGASYLFKGSDWQDQVEQGTGLAYGMEFMISKNTGLWNGWVSYTLSKTDRQFSTINHGKTYPFKYDRRHYLTIVALFKPNDKIDFSASWIFSSGYWATVVSEKYYSPFYDYSNYFTFISNYSTVEHIESRNNYRTPSYHRLDIGINLHKQKVKYKRTLSFGVYNAYFRRNPLYIEYTNSGFRMVSLIPFLPYMDYSIYF